MTKISDIAEQITNSDDASSPELIKVDVQVRTGGTILPPSRLKKFMHDEPTEPSPRKR